MALLLCTIAETVKFCGGFDQFLCFYSFHRAFLETNIVLLFTLPNTLSCRIKHTLLRCNFFLYNRPKPLPSPGLPLPQFCTPGNWNVHRKQLFLSTSSLPMEILTIFIVASHCFPLLRMLTMGQIVPPEDHNAPSDVTPITAHDMSNNTILEPKTEKSNDSLQVTPLVHGMEPVVESWSVNSMLKTPHHLVLYNFLKSILSCEALPNFPTSFDGSLFRTGDRTILYPSLCPLQHLPQAGLSDGGLLCTCQIKFTWRTAYHKISWFDSKLSRSSEERGWTVSNGFLWWWSSRGSVKTGLFQWTLEVVKMSVKSGKKEGSWHTWGPMKEAVPSRVNDLMCFGEGHEIG